MLSHLKDNHSEHSLLGKVYRKMKYVVRATLSLRGTKALLREVGKLDVADSGTTEDGTPYVRLNNGPVFYGYLPSRGMKLRYNIASREIKAKISKPTFAVACDIVIRYMAYGLKYGGPAKEKYYQVRKGDVVAEMGAYLGHYIVRLSHAVGPDGKVIAIEPIPDNLKLLRKNVSENNLRNVVIVPKGVWKEKSTMTIHLGKGGMQANTLVDIGLSWQTDIEIEVASLDSIFGEHDINFIDFMVIQLNGAEIEAIEGLERTEACNISIAARYKRNGEPAYKTILPILQGRGYNVVVEDEECIFASKCHELS